MIVKTKDLISLFDVTAQTIGNWRDKGLKSESRGLWDLKKVLGWYVLNIVPDKLMESDETLADVKKFFWSARSKREQLKFEIERGELIQKSDVEKSAFEMARMTRDALQNIPSRVAAVLAPMKKESEVEKILDREIRRTLEILAKD